MHRENILIWKLWTFFTNKCLVIMILKVRFHFFSIEFIEVTLVSEII